jgi:glycerate 2-kinase
MSAAVATAPRLGYATRRLHPPITGPASAAWRGLVEAAGAVSRPGCIVASGETTVVVAGDGRGGRNQELALSSLETLSTIGPAALASVGTDGIDGPTDAAGAFVDSQMWSRLGDAAGQVVGHALANHDSYPVLERLGALVRTGPTGTNVADLMVLLLH